ncbi:MAG: TIGR03862 family flavoprotein [Gammaproteobacteria bacterium]|nr:TIGR03862 family flavoprotein [Gammaproteobacteria bacterium]MBU2286050.1 TIGR03862 family flavoprotein [Gammaproteobacteria bacterium]
MAAEVLSSHGAHVDLYDAMPSVGRKFLLAGRGGLNLTHAEPYEAFVSRFGSRSDRIAPLLRAFGPAELRAWTEGLGIRCFVGTSGRVFPEGMKAAPLLRAWLHRLRAAGVRFHMRHRWLGWSEDSSPSALRFDTPTGEIEAVADATVLALGGASWARLGSDGRWVPWLERRGVEVAPLQPANCGFDVAGWTPYFIERFAGMPFKSVAISMVDSHGHRFARKGEFVATATGVEGSLVYAASALLRDEIESQGNATVSLDLLPDRTLEHVRSAVRHPRGARSLTSHLKSRLGLEGIKAGVLHEVLTHEEMRDPDRLAEAIKGLPIRLVSARPLDEAISTAGGVRFESLDDGLRCLACPEVFCAGEMLDWEAPTGGYLLTASMASGAAAARACIRHWT